METIGPGRNAWHADRTAIDLTRDRPEPDPVVLPTTTQTVTLDLTRTVLIVVDMQNDFCAPGGWLSHIGVDVSPTAAAVAPIALLAPALRERGVPIVWLNWGNRPDKANLPPGVLHVYDPDGESTGIGDPLPGSGSPVLERGSWSAGLVDGLEAAPEDLLVDKYRMSGFFDTELDSILRNLDATSLLFAGVNVDQCVLATLSDAACIGYDCLLLADCCATTSPPFCAEATVYNVAQCFGFVADSVDLLKALAHAG